MPYRTILLAYDGTAEGRRALQEGAEVAKHLKAKTHLLAVVADDAGAAMAQAGGAAAPMERTQFYQGTLNEGVKFLKGEGLDATGYLVHGDPVAKIVKLAERVKADLVVVGHRERGPVARWWNTPTSMSLLDKLDCSVLIGMKPGPTQP
jgi:nucleotide-binding universal stress UspA family protein